MLLFGVTECVAIRCDRMCYSNFVPYFCNCGQGDQMGMSRTLQTITFMAHLRDNLGACGPYLIVVSLSALGSCEWGF